MLVMAPEATYFDTSSNLIQAGRFDALFPKETIHFDAETGRFTIKD